MPPRARRPHAQHTSPHARSAPDTEGTSTSSGSRGSSSTRTQASEAQLSSSILAGPSAAPSAPQTKRSSGRRRARSDSADIDNDEDARPQRQSRRRRLGSEADAAAADIAPPAGPSSPATETDAPASPTEGEAALPDEPASAPEDVRDLFYQQVWAVTRAVPAGRVTTYGQFNHFRYSQSALNRRLPVATRPGHIAKVLGRPRNSRLVGQALKFLPRNMGLPPEEITAAGGDPATHVPWHRVINARGVISARGSVRVPSRSLLLMVETGLMY